MKKHRLVSVVFLPTDTYKKCAVFLFGFPMRTDKRLAILKLYGCMIILALTTSLGGPSSVIEYAFFGLRLTITRF